MRINKVNSTDLQKEFQVKPVQPTNKIKGFQCQMDFYSNTKKEKKLVVQSEEFKLVQCPEKGIVSSKSLDDVHKSIELSTEEFLNINNFAREKVLNYNNRGKTTR